MPKQLRFEVFITKTDQFKEQTLGATPSIYQGSPASFAFALFDQDEALVPIAERYTDLTLEVWADQDAGARLLQKTVAAAQFDATCLLADWEAKTKAPVVFDLTGTELNFAIAAGKTKASFYMVIGGTPTAGEPETLGYATLSVLKDRFGEPGETVEADPASYLTAAQSDARYGGLRNDITARTGGGATALDGLATAGGAVITGTTLRTRSGPEGAREEWALEAGTDAEDAEAGIVRPDDYDGTTNARVWVRIA